MTEHENNEFIIYYQKKSGIFGILEAVACEIMKKGHRTLCLQLITPRMVSWRIASRLLMFFKLQVGGGTVYPVYGQFIPGIKCPGDTLSRNTGSIPAAQPLLLLFASYASNARRFFEIKKETCTIKSVLENIPRKSWDQNIYFHMKINRAFVHGTLKPKSRYPWST